MDDKLTSSTEKQEESKEVKSVKKQGLILRFFSWLAKGTENDSKTNPFCST